MNHMEYKRMVVKVQTMVDEAKDKQKGKSVETMGGYEDDQSKANGYMGRQRVNGIGHWWNLKIGLYDITNIENVKKPVMKYHWLEDTMFFQNLVVPRPTEQRMLIKKIHEEMQTLWGNASTC
jgi:hypothetical protein